MAKKMCIIIIINIFMFIKNQILKKTRWRVQKNWNCCQVARFTHQTARVGSFLLPGALGVFSHQGLSTTKNRQVWTKRNLSSGSKTSGTAWAKTRRAGDETSSLLFQTEPSSSSRRNHSLWEGSLVYHEGLDRSNQKKEIRCVWFEPLSAFKLSRMQQTFRILLYVGCGSTELQRFSFESAVDFCFAFKNCQTRLTSWFGYYKVVQKKTSHSDVYSSFQIIFE